MMYTVDVEILHIWCAEVGGSLDGQVQIQCSAGGVVVWTVNGSLQHGRASLPVFRMKLLISACQMRRRTL